MGGNNYFKDLNLPLSATASDVRDAYKKLAKQWHPDKNRAEGAEAKFKDVLAAYTHLQSDDRRETHARELKRQQDAAAAPKPPPQPPPQPSPQTNTPKTHTRSTEPPPKRDSSRSRPKCSRPKSSKTNASSDSQSWWDTFNLNKDQQSTFTNRNKPRPKQPRPRMHIFMDSFGFDDPFDDILFNVFMIPPERLAPKHKSQTDRFGNRLPKNMNSDIYDWKSATKTTGQMPDYQDYLDG